MTILLTNDDGYKSEGIAILESFLKRAGHEIWVCAPSHERSASSHSMTLRGEIIVTEYSLMHYHCSGTPSDCILYARKGNLFPRIPDLVISGINHGYNISTDILYSGTVGAASEAALMDMKSIAISCMKDSQGQFPFVHAAQFLVDHLSSFYPLCSAETILNINMPPNWNGNWKACGMSHLDYHDAVEKQQNADQKTYDTNGVRFGTSIIMSLKGGIPPVQKCDSEGTDFQAVTDGFASVSALSVLPPLNTPVQEKLVAMGKRSIHV
ncbi:5'/3'-nucleotidase SurE [Sphaerochaeta pleomorpha str. Grapes]|uniref:5'-nucleotidase SurE n=1 Tax=Sphaerochaeta pleomorpha (strain ATCC BAA-1885 / DSM 22778 / Grapes) TaxID=158190 RepID=G8QRX1_SPHPG|nr:5'/3'-nucleotidase SurE [Sphaerochaeta pleomorpha]AEV29969.1 5'/3'-nucleotidase SurE [Sphaerochaeta pleomorpha str. Grapes]